jgi:hypothetical protein
MIRLTLCDSLLSLGPDTGDLGLRIGLHSGPVTAGVLRGDRSRFQLFGDCVNTASRMESSGVANKIQVSAETKRLLEESGKGHWLQRRQDIVVAKGKGLMETYWLNPRAKRGSSVTSDQSHEKEVLTLTPKTNSKKQDRLVDWNVDLLVSHMKKIAARRKAADVKCDPASELIYTPPYGKTCLDEVAEIIKLPKFDAALAVKEKAFATIEIDAQVVEQLREVVSTIALAYVDNPFHNFEHGMLCFLRRSQEKIFRFRLTPVLFYFPLTACHVTMCVDK